MRILFSLFLLQLMTACASLALNGSGSAAPPQIADQCVAWFENAHIDPSDRDCRIKCAIIPTDLGTFNCGLRCEDFCGEPCAALKYDRIKSVRPKNWYYPNESLVSWKSEEKSLVAKILASVPDTLAKNLKYVFRMSESVTPGNPATTSHFGEMALYNLFFKGSYSPNEIIIHEIGHTLFDHFSQTEQETYAKVAGWQPANGSDDFDVNKPMRLSRDVVLRQNSRTDISEDFADNFAGYLLRTDGSTHLPVDILNWLQEKFGQKFKLRKPCES